MAIEGFVYGVTSQSTTPHGQAWMFVETCVAQHCEEDITMALLCRCQRDHHGENRATSSGHWPRVVVH
eukprot:7209423-Pyramimonas_sp.AAC.1